MGNNSNAARIFDYGVCNGDKNVLVHGWYLLNYDWDVLIYGWDVCFYSKTYHANRKSYMISRNHVYFHCKKHHEIWNYYDVCKKYSSDSGKHDSISENSDSNSCQHDNNSSKNDHDSVKSYMICHFHHCFGMIHQWYSQFRHHIIHHYYLGIHSYDVETIPNYHSLNL